ncbi:hypothetical protein GCM10022409_28130 [Hymenobacter glaciei]|uniref:YD repeat-containing protein n=1 Tax=Hymenobacter glaciei TaxID=877209 RepID=A0ABP7UCU6_9BACT
MGSAHAQTTTIDKDKPWLPAKYIPQSPTVSTLPRFDAQQLVQLHSGAAQYSIPLVEVTCGPLSLPVSLSYSYSGLRVSQPDDLVGLGWNLQAGASITRQVNGLVDEQVAAVPIRRYHPDSVLHATARVQYLKRAFNHDLDTGPDVYSFSLPTGVSGRFVIIDTSVVLLPRQPVFIRRVAVDGFQISTEDGVRYLFQARELTTPSAEYGMNIHVSAWHLSRVISADAADTLTLHYTAATVLLPRQMSTTTGRYYTGSYQELGEAVNAAGPGTICGSTADYLFQNILAGVTHVRAQFLQSITARGVCLRVNRETAGPDSVREIRSVQWLSTGPQAREVRHWTLFQSRIYEATTNGPIPGTRYRLCLDSLRESANGVNLPAYRFDYLPIGLMPTKGSAAQDYWGYFNGAVKNGDLRNKDTRPALLADTALLRRQGMAADREPNFEMVGQGALRTVGFPTGGQANWEYELNRIAVQAEDLPLRERGPYLEASYDPTRVQLVENGPLTHRATSSPPQEFDVPNRSDESGRFDVRVLLHRQPYDSTHATAGTNQVRDFSIWRRRASGDSLITNGPYRIFDGQLDNNQQPVTYRTFVLRLPPGRYVARVHCEETEHQSDINIYVPYLDSTDFKLGLPGPGIRVWRTTHQTAGAPPLVHTYRYSEHGSCSGVSLLRNYGRNFDRQQHTEVNYQLLPTSGDHSALSVTSCEFWETTADNRDLGDEFSKNVHYYSCVREEAGTDNGLTVHYFGELREQFNDVVPFQQLVYRRSRDNQLQLAESTAHTYDMQDAQMLPFIRVRRTVKINLLTPGVGVYIPEDTYISDLYLVRASFAAPAQTVQTRYDPDGRTHTVTTLSSYVQQRLVRTATSTSTGWDIQRFKRLSDYASTVFDPALRLNTFNPVIEAQRWHRPLAGTDSVLTGGSLTLYDPRWRSPAKTHRLRLDRPVSGPNQETRANGRYTGWLSDTRYEATGTARYATSSGDLIEQRPAHGPATAYLTGNVHTLVIAQATNAGYEQLACTSFEPAATGRWRYDSTGTHRVAGGRTGRWAYRLDGTSGPTRPGMPAGDYGLLCWARSPTAPTLTLAAGSTGGTWQLVATGPDGWRQYRARFQLSGSGSVALGPPAGGGNVLVDEVRLAPVGAQVTSYTHDPLVGVTSQTDPGGRTITFEYDALGRLVRTRDEQGRILSQQQYHYARP